MQNADKSTSSDEDDFSYFDGLLSFYHSIGWKPSRFRRRRTTFEKVIAHANKTAKYLNKIKSRQLACANRAKSIPEKATIRKEYIKCGRSFVKKSMGLTITLIGKILESRS